MFHLRWSSYAWPPNAAMRSAAAHAFAPILSDTSFAVDRREWLAAVRLP
jgi:hypothetical protein